MSYPLTDLTGGISNYGYAPNRQNRNGRKPVAIVVHRMDGSFNSGLSWFQDPASDASSNYGVRYDGSRGLFVPSAKSSWANGITNNPDRTLPWLDWCLRNGVNPNEVTVTIECEGKGNGREGWLETQYQGLLQTIKEECAKWGIAPGAQTVVGHFRLDSVNRPGCPGQNFPWQRLMADLAAPAIHGLSAFLWSEYNAQVGEGDLTFFGNVLYEATADLSQYGLAKAAQCLVMEKSVWWTDGVRVDSFHRGQYESLVAGGKVQEWK